MTRRRKRIRVGETIEGKEKEKEAALAILKEAGTKVREQKKP